MKHFPIDDSDSHKHLKLFVIHISHERKDNQKLFLKFSLFISNFYDICSI